MYVTENQSLDFFCPKSYPILYVMNNYYFLKKISIVLQNQAICLVT